MERDELPTIADSCPCGAGQVQIAVWTEDNGWSMKSGWIGKITCESCNPQYAFVTFGRGVALVRAEDVTRSLELQAEAERKEREILESQETRAVLDSMADALEALPSAAAKHRFALEIGVETATLPTFRKHTRGLDMHQWLSWKFPTDENTVRSVKRLLPLYKHLGVDPRNIETCLAAALDLRHRATEMPEIVKSWGPINLFAAISEDAGGRGARGR
jgi:hypothetical protein